MYISFWPPSHYKLVFNEFYPMFISGTLITQKLEIKLASRFC